MRNNADGVCRQTNRLFPALHLLLAALYAFVLPFICAGAQATPGHPHARAHFVFVEPEMAHEKIPATVNHKTVNHKTVNHKTVNHKTVNYAMAKETHDNPMAMAQNEVACFIHHADNATSADQFPAGRSVPMQMVISGLIPVGAMASMLPLLTDGVGFSVWLAESIIIPFVASVPTPPPR